MYWNVLKISENITESEKQFIINIQNTAGSRIRQISKKPTLELKNVEFIEIFSFNCLKLFDTFLDFL